MEALSFWGKSWGFMVVFLLNSMINIKVIKKIKKGPALNQIYHTYDKTGGRFL